MLGSKKGTAKCRSSSLVISVWLWEEGVLLSHAARHVTWEAICGPIFSQQTKRQIRQQTLNYRNRICCPPGDAVRQMPAPNTTTSSPTKRQSVARFESRVTSDQGNKRDQQNPLFTLKNWTLDGQEMSRRTNSRQNQVMQTHSTRKKGSLGEGSSSSTIFVLLSGVR